MNLVKVILGVAAALTAASIAQAEPNNAPDGYFQISSVETTKISQTDGKTTSDFLIANNTGCDSQTGVKPLGLDGILPDLDISTIINLGQKLWSFIQANAAVVTVKTMSANALPSGATCWNQLENWHPPRSEVYRTSYKNLFGYEVVNLEFALVYSYGGQVHGVGKYLTNATVLYRNLDVAWGYNLDANVEVPMVTNIGTEQVPVGGLQLNLHWKVTNPLTHIENTAGFFVSGDGRATQQL